MTAKYHINVLNEQGVQSNSIGKKLQRTQSSHSHFKLSSLCFWRVSTIFNLNKIELDIHLLHKINFVNVYFICFVVYKHMRYKQKKIILTSVFTYLINTIVKPQWDITTYLSEELKLKIVTIPNVDKHAEKLDHSLLLKVWNSTATVQHLDSFL